MSVVEPQVNFLKDYQPPLFAIETVNLTFDLSPLSTQVTNRMQIRALQEEAVDLVLYGEHLTLLEVIQAGQVLQLGQDYALTGTELTLFNQAGDFELEIVTQIAPQDNTRLEGLYRTSGNYCTQCEAEGFRAITYFLDRPDVLSLYTTKIIADQAENAVLLSNGNLIESGELADGKHYAIWQDPFKKPSYLFALVAGNLSRLASTFTTQEGREVALEFYVEPQNIDKCDHAIASLKASMKWDERRFGLSYDLDRYMIVAVDDFNMGAMENKGLNVFNSKFVLAKPDTATDVDFAGIESVIGHEYFHNWTGNRITCRDWFQLTLKEGLTVFRDQEFSADLLSRPVKRIEDVKHLRSFQFAEDRGPMAHPIQPQSYIEMNNFYTLTVYEKGAEVVRLYHTLLGEAGFQKGMRLYVERHDGQAVTVGDFRAAMADANQVNLDQMQAWYVQAGTPELKVVSNYDSQAQCLTLSVSQWLQGEQTHQPFLIPLRLGLLSKEGQALVMQPCEQTQAAWQAESNGGLLKVTELEHQFVFHGVAEEPCLSLLRGFSAPIYLSYESSVSDKATLVQYDRDEFVRWEAMQSLMLQEVTTLMTQVKAGDVIQLSAEFIAVFRRVLQQPFDDLAFKAHLLTLPDFGWVCEQFQPMEVDLTQQAYEGLRAQLAQVGQADFYALYQSLSSDDAYHYQADALAQRRLRNLCLYYLVTVQPELAQQQFLAQQNMTNVWAALSAINDLEVDFKADLQQAFYQQWQGDPLVLDKWFALQASAKTSDALITVKALLKHPEFSYTNPNRVRSVLGVFGRMNPIGFHRADGEGYRLLADAILQLDAINPQVAARILAPFTQWRAQSAERQALMLAQLQRIADQAGLSKDVFEIVSKSLVQSGD